MLSLFAAQHLPTLEPFIDWDNHELHMGLLKGIPYHCSDATTGVWLGFERASPETYKALQELVTILRVHTAHI